MISKKSDIRLDEISNLLEVSIITVKRDIDKLKKAGLIYREGSDKSGKWLVKKDESE